MYNSRVTRGREEHDKAKAEARLAKLTSVRRHVEVARWLRRLGSYPVSSAGAAAAAAARAWAVRRSRVAAVVGMVAAHSHCVLVLTLSA